MADLTLHRDHDLGRERARQVALKWAALMEEKLEMECRLVDGVDHDVLEFTRPGVDGRMTVAARFFDVEATLGFMFKPFVGMIEAQASKKLDEAIVGATAPE